MANAVLPIKLTETDSPHFASPSSTHERLVAEAHQRIDQACSTNLAGKYTPEAKAANDPITYGIMPPPMSGGKAPGNLKDLAKSGQVIDRGGYTKAGRALMKHGSRDGSVFPKPTGNPAQINQHGQEVLEAILSHPEKTVLERPHPDFGKVVDVFVPNEYGVRFTVDGEMVGFLEPRLSK